MAQLSCAVIKGELVRSAEQATIEELDEELRARGSSKLKTQDHTGGAARSSPRLMPVLDASVLVEYMAGERQCPIDLSQFVRVDRIEQTRLIPAVGPLYAAERVPLPV